MSTPAYDPEHALRIVVVEREPFAESVERTISRAPDLAVIASCATLADVEPQHLHAAEVVYIGEHALLDGDPRLEQLGRTAARVVVGQTRAATEGGEHWLALGAAAVVSRTARPQTLIGALRRAAVRMPATDPHRIASGVRPQSRPAPVPAPDPPTVVTPLRPQPLEQLDPPAAVALERRIRGELAAVLHDGPLQILLAARQEIEAAEDGDELALGRARRYVYDAALQLRDQLRDLDMPDPDVLGLTNALRRIGEQQAERATAEFEFFVEPDLESPAAQFLVAIARELLVNTARHARAQRVAFLVERRDDLLHLRVADDGVGMDAERESQAAGEGHLGLALVRRRVEAAGGTLAVVTAPGAGMTVDITVPAA